MRKVAVWEGEAPAEPMRGTERGSAGASPSQCRNLQLELPHGAKPLLGAVPLEQMDWHLSPLDNRLVPNPESPDGPLVPMCRMMGTPEALRREQRLEESESRPLAGASGDVPGY